VVGVEFVVVRSAMKEEDCSGVCLDAGEGLDWWRDEEDKDDSGVEAD